MYYAMLLNIPMTITLVILCSLLNVNDIDSVLKEMKSMSASTITINKHSKSDTLNFSYPSSPLM